MYPLTTLFQNLLIAVALAMDAFAVALAMGAACRELRVRHALRVGVWFGSFQAIMPIIGWFLGAATLQWAAHVDHWIIFAVLTFVGGKMIFESFKIKEIEERPALGGARALFVLSLATSLDALGIGLTFAMQDVAIIAPALIIGVVTFFISFAGFLLGGKGRHFFETRIEALGGIILIGIALKILIAHLRGTA